MSLRVCSLFSGIGGIDLAFEQTGADIMWANEIDPYVCKIYRHNFGKDFLIEGDIRDIKAEMIPNMDILAAGFPCQSFSIMGMQHGFADPRGSLFFEMARVIQIIRPTIVSLENV